ncbi:MAG: SprB repeat-containing protein, partial [Cyclobacteriaceae bacterium]|nr:SprB repeat-containing protein [Cyclobacteriaceae bacterium]
MVTKIFRSLFLVGALFFSYKSYAQPAFSVQNVKGACEGFNNGSFEVLVTAGTGTIEVFYFGGGPFFGGPIAATIGTPVLITGLAGAAFPGRSYTIIVQDDISSTNGSVSILTYPALLSVTVDNVVDNADCLLSNGSIDITPSGGSGAYTYLWEEASLGFTANTQDISGLLGGNYQLTLGDPSTNCVLVLPPINVANPSPLLFNVITPTPVIVCAGTDWVLGLDGSEVGATYEVFRNNVIATGITLLGTGAPINFTIPAGSFANGDNFKVRATNGICSGDMTGVVVANIVPLPTILGVAVLPVCEGTTNTNLTYTSTTGSPNQYSIDFDAAAEAQGFVDIVNAALPVSPVGISVPGGAAAGSYNGNLTVVNSGIGCVSLPQAISVTVNLIPTISLGVNPAVCIGSATADLGYVGTTGSPDQYSI